ncbi:epoxyqueuosine reductase QueH [Helicobacter muridarum]|uniref:Epoxyqueuosine reductase QueH n=1 Tax=Helicobacter muridarum TaxID=216 RepID=A0A377PXR9_9HELI|nr:epoxyqueuosine reductase QueH [Helicobacter muridarum]TLE00145.1 epoxyqueuosine reductase QueH [Helicobacter muridarum]STQ87051.1 FIG053235: Diacylglucosamine hydrolase like [Helicobacter muridarum]
MLVHICCSVDSHYFLKELHKAYPDENLVGFFYNPNIHPKEEHDLRLQDVRRSCNMLNICLIEGEYDVNSWLQDVKGLENEPEKGCRCNKCFDNRLLKTASIAKELNISKFTTTLLSSPMKEQQVLYHQGDVIAKENNLEFVKINVRANGGVNKQNELAKNDNLYRQNYCGCQFALKAQRNKQKKISLEMMSNITKQVMPGSIEARHHVFSRRDALEKSDIGYILTQKKHLVWRLLHAQVMHKKEVIPSYIIARSGDKNLAKSGNIVWIKQKLGDLHVLYNLDDFDIDNMQRFIDMIAAKQQEYNQNFNLLVGYSKRDDSVFIDIDMFNFLLNKNYIDVKSLSNNPPSYQEELKLRHYLCGIESMNPIIVLDSKIPHDIIVSIISTFQEENIYDVIEEYKYCKL